MKYEITLTPNYVESWGTWEGIRELVQNARDGEIEHGASMRIQYRESGILSIKNRSITLPKEALLIGFTTKKDKKETIGQFGEGLKLGCLALCRQGFKIRIRNGEEIWKPEIIQSDRFNMKVLTFDVTKSRARNVTNDLEVEVHGLSRKDWDELKKRFLFISKPRQLYGDTYYGDLILDQTHRGMVFMKGIYVQQIDSHFGYNFKNGTLDRDRAMVKSFDMDWNCSHIIASTFSKYPDLQSRVIDNIMDMLNNNANEVKHLDSAWTGDNALRDAVKARLVGEHGEDMVAVSNMAESKEVEYFNRKGVVVSSSISKLVGEDMGYKTVMEKMGKEPVKWYGWRELSDNEQYNLTMAIRAIEQVDNPIIPKDLMRAMNVVDFPNEDVLGEYRGRTTFLISKKVVQKLSTTIHAIVHEACHAAGDDGNARHAVCVGDILSEIAAIYIDKHTNQGGECGQGCINPA